MEGSIFALAGFFHDESHSTTDKGLRIVCGELIPQCRHTYPISDYDKNGEEFNRHPDTISGIRVYSLVKERYREDKKYLDKKNPIQNLEIWAYKRAEFWIFCVWLYYYERYTQENVQLCRDLMDFLELDEAVMFEMRDIAEAYKFVTESADKKDLDASIEALIELG